MPRRSFKRTMWPLLGGLAASLIFILAQTTLLAQATLVSSNPKDNEVFRSTALPTNVTLTFSEALKSEGSSLQVVNTVRNQVDQGKVTVNDKTISVDLNKNIAAADYSVEYSVVSASDGKTTSGSYNFKIVPTAGSPLDAGYLFSTPTSAFGENWDIYFPWALVFFIVFIIGAIIANVVYFYGKYRFFRNNRLTYTMVNRASRNAAIAFSLGVFFFLCRIANLQPFNARFWLYLSVALLIYYVFRGVVWRAREYPKAKAAWQEIQLRQQRKKGLEPAVAAPPAAKPAAIAKPATTAKPVPTTGTLASGSGDAGGEEKIEIPPAQRSAETPRGLSQRGQKRREKKRR